MEPYIPEKLPVLSINWEEHISEIGKANAAIARYDGILQGIVNPEILLSPLTTREAVISSRIEGTVASLEEVLHFEANIGQKITPEKKADIQEIINYRKATQHAIEQLKSKPICFNNIRDLHKILLTSVRGQDKEPGEIRRIQNFIAPYGTPFIEKAIFIPPPPQMVMDALTNWEFYLHQEEKDSLVQTAILKAQFEIIHPFRDGNGRIGRMLVPIILYNKHHISTPMFYISSYFDKNRDKYSNCLLGVSQEHDWDSWISFFLHGIIDQSHENSKKVRDVLALHNEIKAKVPQITGSKYIIQAIDAIFSRPVINAAYFKDYSHIPEESARRILRELVKADILKVWRKGTGPNPYIYIFPQLLKITDDISANIFE